MIKCTSLRKPPLYLLFSLLLWLHRHGKLGFFFYPGLYSTSAKVKMAQDMVPMTEEEFRSRFKLAFSTNPDLTTGTRNPPSY
jgi:hypothetical protein